MICCLPESENLILDNINGKLLKGFLFLLSI